MTNFFTKILLAIKSRTAWTAAILFVVNYLPMVRDLIPAEWLPVIDAVLGLLIVVFHVNPSQEYKLPKRG